MCQGIERDPNTELLKAMARQIELYAAGKKQYPTLVNELDAGLRGLLDSYSDVRDRLREEWRVLEEINALALDEGSMVPLDEHKHIVERTLSRIAAIAKERLDTQ